MKENNKRKANQMSASKAPTSARERLLAFYEEFNPSKLASVDTILTKYSGREDVLFSSLHNKYTKHFTDQVVLSAGSGDCGQLGLGVDFLEVEKPQVIKTLSGLGGIALLRVGGMHNVVLSTDGRVFTWGCNDDGALGRSGDENIPAPIPDIKDKITEITCGDCHTLALTESGTILGWGTFRDSGGIMGFDEQTKRQMTPAPVRGLERYGPFVAIASGAHHALAMNGAGKVFAWGCAQQGQIARRVPPRRRSAALRPHPVTLPKGIQVASLACGGYHSFIVSKCGKVFSWGLNNYGQLGVGKTTGDSCLTQPTHVSALDEFKGKLLHAGTHYSTCLADGKIIVFGRADSGQLGLGDEATTAVFEPKVLQGLPYCETISCGDVHTVAVCNGGKSKARKVVYTWGYGEMLQLCNGKEQDEPKPHLVDFDGIAAIPKMLHYHVVEAHAGGQHTVILAEKGSSF